MKTTITIEGELAAQIARAAEAAGVDVNQLVNDLVREALKKQSPAQKPMAKPFKQVTHKLGWYPGMTWERIQEILLEEEAEQYRLSQSNQ